MFSMNDQLIQMKTNGDQNLPESTILFQIC